MTSIIDKAKKDMAELGQGGVSRLHSVEILWDAFKADGSEANKLALDAALIDLHRYGAHAYKQLGLTLVSPSEATGTAGEVHLLSGGGGGKDNPPPPGGG